MSSKKPKKSAPKKSKPPARVKKVTKIDLSKAEAPIQEYAKSMPVVMTAIEKETRDKEAGQLHLRIESLEGEKRSKNEAINAELKKANARLDQLLSSMDSGIEDREVKVVVIPDFKAKVVYTVRRDTSEVIDQRAMKPEEKDAGVVEAKPEEPKGRKISRAPKKVEGAGADEPKSDEPPSDDKTDEPPADEDEGAE